MAALPVATPRHLAHDSRLPNNNNLEWDKYAKAYDLPGAAGDVVHVVAKAVAHQMEVAKHAKNVRNATYSLCARGRRAWRTGEVGIAS